MENFTIVRFKYRMIQSYTYILFFLVFGLSSSFGHSTSYNNTSIPNILEHGHLGNMALTQSASLNNWNPFAATLMNEDCDGDGVTCEQEKLDGTDPNDPCDFILEHQNCTPSDAWKKDDCDGDGVSNGKEKADGTDPLDACDFVLEHQDCSVSDAWKKADCDGDGVSNGKEKEDGTDPLDPCDFVLEHQDCSVYEEWKKADCDGDGVTNEDEVEDGTDPLDPCDYNPESITLPQSGDYLEADCDGDGVTNEDEEEDGTDPQDPCDFVLDSQTMDTSSTWNTSDCDGDGVTNEDEVEDGTDPLDPCDYNPESITLPQSGDYLEADCDGDGVTNEDEEEDGTDPTDPCDFNLESQTVDPSSTWSTSDCDGDGVTNEDEVEDGTDPLDPCDYNPESVTLPQSGDYLEADCDGDGVTNEDEEEDGTDPTDPCDFNLDSQTVDPSSTWNTSDCDGDGVTNEDEVEDGTDPLDPCDYNPESITLEPSEEWNNLDCDGDGNPNGNDPDPLNATARDDSGSTPALTEVAINILENDDYLPNNDATNQGVTNLSRIGGDATGTLTLDAETGILTYVPTLLESNSTVTIVYQVCNVNVDPNVCTSATVYIEVGSNVLDAVDDAFATTNQGGVIPESNVLSNDTLNGEQVNLEDVILTSTPTDALSIDEDGNVSVTPGTVPGTYTIDYTICELANPDNCDSATVTVVVEEDMSGNIIDAVDDAYVSSEGDIADSNVLSNDTFNGGVASLEDVILTSTPTDALIINDDGSVTVVPGTEPGTYTIDYTICEIASTDNCDTATVTVVVEEEMAGNVIDAIDDAYVAMTEGDIVDSNVLTNDTLNDESVSLETVILSSTPTEVLTINIDGSVTVAPETAPGTYTIDYTICEIANIDNCDTATVTVVVSTVPPPPPPADLIIDAVDDSYIVDSDDITIDGSNVLLNDTLDGEQANLETVILSSTPNGILTINADGSVMIEDGIPSGTYTIEYTICEIANVDNCDTATVTVIIEEDDDDDDDASKIEVNQMLTPNGDLKNDFLFIRGVDRIRNSTLRIFNRWGVAVYEGKNYDNINNVFDGRSRGRSSLGVNKYLPAGVYFYIFNYETDEGSFTDSEYIYISR